MNKIALAVAPLKQDAIERAEKEALVLIERCTKQLEEKDFDINVVAPYPRYGTYCSTADYHYKASRHVLFMKLVSYRDKSPCRRFKDKEPEYVDICPEKVAKFIQESKEDAAIQYDAFVGKLVAKIGEVTEASLLGNHVWSFSILTVTKEDGSLEKWKTQMIVNVSKLGKLFNQWPTRKVKK